MSGNGCHELEQDMASYHGMESQSHRQVTGHLLGVALIVLVACIWVGASQLISAIFLDLNFDKPYFMTYFNTCGFSLWLCGALCVRRWRAQLCKPLPSAVDSMNSKCGAWTYASVAASVCPAWMLANYLFNLSLDRTSVASNSVLSTTSNIWTMLFSACFLNQRIDPIKIVAVIAVMVGAIVVANVDTEHKDSGQNTFGGDAVALTSACTYGVYSVILKLRVPDGEEGLSMPLVFGFVGLFVLLGGWPVLLVLHALSWETFEWPPSKVMGCLIVNALVGTNLSDVLWARALQLTTPLVATLGLSLTLPIGMASDAALHGTSFSPAYVCGAALVLLGFVLGAISDRILVRWSSRRTTTSLQGSESFLGSESPIPQATTSQPLSLTAHAPL